MKRSHRTALFRVVVLVLVGLFAIFPAPTKAFSSTDIAQRGLAEVERVGSFLHDTTYGFVDAVFVGAEALIDVGGDVLVALRSTTDAFADGTIYGLVSILTGVSDIGRASQDVLVDTGHDFAAGARAVRDGVTTTFRTSSVVSEKALATAVISVEAESFGGPIDFLKLFYIAFGEESVRASELLFASGMDAFNLISDGFEIALDPIRTVHQLTTETGYGFGQSIGEGFLALGTYPEEIWYQSESFVQNNRIIVDTGLALQESGRMTRTALVALSDIFDTPSVPVERDVELASMQPIVVPPLDITPDRLVANASTALGSWWGTIVDGVDSAVAVVVDFFSGDDTVIVQQTLPTPREAGVGTPTESVGASHVVTTFVSSEPQTTTNVYNTAHYLTTTGGGISMTQLALAIIGLRDELEPQIELAMERPRSNFNNDDGDANSEDLDDYLLLSGGTLTGALGGTDGTFSGALSAATLTVVGSTTLNGVEYLFPSSDGSDNYVLTTDSNGALTWEAGAVGGITSLGGLSGASQTFATSSDTNIGLTIVSSGTTHTFTPAWIGTLAAGRGGTGTSTVNANELLIGNAGGTAWTTIATSSLGIISDHGGLTGLSDDDHTQYALLAGRPGQILDMSTTGVLQFGTTINDPSIRRSNNTRLAIRDATNAFLNDLEVDEMYANIFFPTGQQWSLNSTGLVLNSSSLVNWTQSSAYNDTIDTGIARSAAGILRISDGGSGGGALLANYFTATSTTATSTFAGAVGIGTTTPGAKVHIVADTTGLIIDGSNANDGVAVLTLRRADIPGRYMSFSPSGLGTSVPTITGSAAILFDTGITLGGNSRSITNINSSLPLTIDGNSGNILLLNGNVGIGTTTPNAKLTLSNNLSSGNIDAYSEYQALLYDAGSATASFGMGVESSTMWFNSPSNYKFYQGGTTAALFIEGSTGEVGIGTTNPQAKLSLGSAADVQKLLLYDDANIRYGFGISSFEMRQFVPSDGHFAFGKIATSDGSTFTPLMTLDAVTGNFGIGTTSPYAKLSVTGDVAITGGIYDSGASLGSSGMVLTSTGTGLDWVATTSMGFGDVVGPASATDNAIARFDLTTGKLIQDSGVTITDTNRVGLASNVFISGELNNFNIFGDSAGAGYTSARMSDLRIHTASPSVVRFALTSGDSTFAIGSSGSIKWTSNTTSAESGADVGLTRDSAGILRISDGASGGGALLANYFTATSTTATSTFAGAVGIGLTNPTYTFEVAGTTNTGTGRIHATGDGAAILTVADDSANAGSSQGKILFTAGGTPVASISGQYNSGTFRLALGANGLNSEALSILSTGVVRLYNSNALVGQDILLLEPSTATASSTRIAWSRSGGWTPAAIGQIYSGGLTYGGALTFYTHPEDGVEGTALSPLERMRITAEGNVGIGSSTPSTKLVVSGGVTGEYFVATSTTATSTFAGVLAVGTSTPPSGNLFTVGTTSPLLSVSRTTGWTTLGSGKRLSFEDGSGTDIRITSSAGYLIFRGKGFDRVAIDGDNSGLITTSGGMYGFTDNPFDPALVPDLALRRASAGVLRIDGTAQGNGAILAGLVTADYFTATSTTATSTFYQIKIEDGGGPAVSLDSDTGGALVLQTAGATAKMRILTSGNDSYLQSSVPSGNFYISGASGADITGNIILQVGSGGKVGIGSSTPSTMLVVAGTSTLQHVLPGGTITGNMSTFDVGATGARWNAMWAGTYNVGTSTWSISSTGPDRFGIFNAASGGGTETLSILQSGNVGIGVAAPAQKLSIAGNVGLSDGATIISDADNGNYFKPFETTTGRMVFRTGSADRMSILYSSGNVGIGETAPGSKLSVSGGASIGASYDTTAAPTNGLIVEGSVGIGTTSVGFLSGVTYPVRVASNSDNPAGVNIVNSSTGVSAATFLTVSNLGGENNIDDSLRFGVNGTGFTTIGGFIQDAGTISAEANLSGGLSIMTRGAAPIAFYTNGHTNERMTIASDGGVGVNDSSPTEGKLTVGGTFYVLTNTAVGADPLCWDGSGGSLYGDCTSLREYKTNITDLGLGTAAVLELTPRRFNWKQQFGGEDDLGFIAEEVADVDPLLARYDKETGALQGVKYERLTALLVKAFQEIVARIDALEAQLAAVGGSVSTTLGNFIEVVTHKLTTDELCVGSTCIDEDQLKELLENSNVSPTPPPADEPPAEEPPAEEPPADEPPAEEPPTEEPPAEEPPADEPPADEPPAEEPPV